MLPQFDISGDLDTPVSAFLKLAAFEPRFLLESVEGGERLARYSFIGFGTRFEVKLDRTGLRDRHRAPAACRRRPAELLAGLRDALARAPRPQPEMPACRSRAAWWDMPPTMSCDSSSASPRARRSTARTPCCTTRRRARCSCSITSRAASRCCTTGRKPSASRCARKSSAHCAARLPNGRGTPRYAPPAAQFSRDAFIARRAARAGIHRRRRHLSARAFRALRRQARAASVRGVSRAALHQSFAVHVLLCARGCHGRRAPRPRRS